MKLTKQPSILAACVGLLTGYAVVLSVFARTDPWLAGYIVYCFAFPAIAIFVLSKVLIAKPGIAMFAYIVAVTAYAAICSAAFKFFAVTIFKTVRPDTWAVMRAVFTAVFAASAALPIVTSLLMRLVSAIRNLDVNRTRS